MAARTNRPNHNQKTRDKIQASQIINRLTDHVLGTVEMSSTQVSAASILLKKTLPDLQAIDHTGTVEHESEHKRIQAESQAILDGITGRRDNGDGKIPLPH